MKPPWDSIAWWEVRRIPYNLAIAAAGTVTVIAVIGIGGMFAKPGEDVIEPLGLLAGGVVFGILANLLYTLGWISELLWSGGDTARSESLRPRVFWLGLIGSVLLTLAPAVLVPLLWMVFHVH
jgi:hypothetical protein